MLRSIDFIFNVESCCQAFHVGAVVADRCPKCWGSGRWPLAHHDSCWGRGRRPLIQHGRCAKILSSLIQTNAATTIQFTTNTSTLTCTSVLGFWASAHTNLFANLWEPYKKQMEAQNPEVSKTSEEFAAWPLVDSKIFQSQLQSMYCALETRHWAS